MPDSSLSSCANLRHAQVGLQQSSSVQHWAGVVKHRLVSARGPEHAQEVELFQAQAFLPGPIAERLPRSIFLDELAMQDQVRACSGLSLKVTVSAPVR